MVDGSDRRPRRGFAYEFVGLSSEFICFYLHGALMEARCPVISASSQHREQARSGCLDRTQSLAGGYALFVFVFLFVFVLSVQCTRMVGDDVTTVADESQGDEQTQS